MTAGTHYCGLNGELAEKAASLAGIAATLP
jgi:hypothetical protein